MGNLSSRPNDGRGSFANILTKSQSSPKPAPPQYRNRVSAIPFLAKITVLRNPVSRVSLMTVGALSPIS